MKYLFVVFIFSSIFGCHNSDNNNNPPSKEITIPAPQNITPNIISVYPHDAGAYTQGLQVYNGKFYEGTGDFEKSSLRITDIKTGKVEQKHVMGSKEVFGEGITIFKNKIFQLTWQSQFVNVYDIKNINKPINTFKWNNEGWGITNDGTDLIVSDGSSNIYFVNDADFTIKKTLPIVDNAGPVDQINELEYIEGYIYANVYLTDYIIKINPSNGQVVGKISLPGLIQQYAPDTKLNQGEVLNGIAYDSTSKKIYITGKDWPKLFEISLN